MEPVQNALQFGKEEAAKLANLHSGTVNLGPLTITWNLDISKPSIVVDAKLHGISIGHAVLDTANPNAKLGGSIGIAKAEVDLNANFTGKQLNYDVDVELFSHIFVKRNGILFSW